MANSSDWIALLAGEEDRARPHAVWIAALDARGEFRPGTPFRTAEPALPPGPSEEDRMAAALAEARAEGEAAGRAAALAEAEAESAHRTGLKLAFRTLDASALDALSQDLAETVIALCSEAIAGWNPDPATLAARCREAASRLGSAPGTLALHLNPADIEALDEELLATWRVVPDPSLERGGLRLEGAEGAVADGPAEWRRAIADAVRG